METCSNFKERKTIIILAIKETKTIEKLKKNKKND